ncbi:hypothetical protein NUW58_g5312 [Xylaria curta]|uniref:Uncharacterized protein n=1 Tax=Xylaria curta TaxID=42375 RepID=A0ACC1P4V3_9PEZI|nr:hypothetical protein NUW58_g5312 [Xylaria curta]
MLPPNFLLQAVRSRNACSGVYSVFEFLPNKESVVTEEVLEAAAARNEVHIMEQLLGSGANITITGYCLRKAALANELVRISITCQAEHGPLEVLLEIYGDRICITEEHLISTMHPNALFALRQLVKHMSRHTLTEDKILSVLKYYQWFDVTEERVRGDRILQMLLSPSPVRVWITGHTAELAARYVPRASEMKHILQLRQRASGPSISESMVAAAAGNKRCGKDILELFCRRESQDKMRGKFTEKAMLTLMSNKPKGEEIFAWIVDSPLLSKFDAITLPVVISAIYNPIPGANILKILIQQGFTFEKKEDIIKVAGTSWLHSYQEFVRYSLSSTSWRLHLTSRGILNFLLRGSGIGLQQYESLLRSVLGDHTDVFLNFSSDMPRYGTVKWTDLHYAVLFGDSCFIQEEGNTGANVNCRNWMQSTPLHLASSLGRFGLVEVLLDNNADINARDKYNRTPLHYAAYAGHLLVVSTLLKRGASVDHIDFIYQTPLHYAVQYGHFSSARELLGHSADANTLDAYGRSANEYIQEKKKRDYPPLPGLEEPQEPRVPRKATGHGGRARLHNVIFILTSQLQGTYNRDTCPGFLQLGHCLALLDEEDKALFAYTQGFEQEVRSIPDHTWGPRRNRELCSPFWYMSLSYHELACSDPSRSETQKREGCKHDGVFRVCKTCVNGVFCGGCWKVRKRSGFGRNNVCRGHDFMTVLEVKFVGKGPECNEGVGRGTTDSVIEWLKKIRDEIGVDPATEQMEE